MLTQGGQGFDRRAEVIRSDIGRYRRYGTLCFPEGNQAVQCVMHTHGRNQRPGEIGAHLPVEADGLARSGSTDKASKSGFSQLSRPAGIPTNAGRKACLAERMDPLGQIMEVLAVPIPLQLLIYRFTS